MRTDTDRPANSCQRRARPTAATSDRIGHRIRATSEFGQADVRSASFLTGPNSTLMIQGIPIPPWRVSTGKRFRSRYFVHRKENTVGKAAELDEELADGLKAAKSKRAYFVLVLKGGSDGALIVSKTKVAPTAIAEAKKKSGGSAVVKGFCKYEDGKYVFETAKIPPATAAQVVKTIAKRDAEQSIHAEFRLSNDPELLAGEGDVPGKTGPSVKPLGEQPQGTSGGVGLAAELERAVGLRQRRGVILEWLKSLKTDPDKAAVVQKLAPVLQQCDQDLKTGKFDEAERKLVVLENYHKLSPKQGEKQHDTAGDEHTAAELHLRREVILNWLKELKVVPGMESVLKSSVLLVKQFDEDLKSGDLGEAEKKMVLLENERALARRRARIRSGRRPALTRPSTRKKRRKASSKHKSNNCEPNCQSSSSNSNSKNCLVNLRA